MMGQAFGLYTHIRNNRWRSSFLLAGLFVLVGFVNFALALIVFGQTQAAPLSVLAGEALRTSLSTLPIAFAIAGGWVAIGFAANTALVGWVTGSKPVTREEDSRLYRLMENLCISRGMSVPKPAIIENEALNAFASGVSERQYTVTVTSGLMAALDDAELEAVLAHELTHIRNGDVRLMMIAVLITGVISFFGELIVRGQRFSSPNLGQSGSGNGKRGGGGGAAILIGIAILVLAWFLAVLIRFSLSRSREYLADAGAVELTKNPDAMISALLKISGRADLDGVPSGIMDMCIENDPDDFGDIFATHPSISKRVAALQAYAGGVLPPRPPRIAERQSLPELVERRGPWSKPANPWK
jgi:heat shock protein HtpX